MKSELGIVEAKFMSVKEGVLGATAYESGCSYTANRVEPRVNSRPYVKSYLA